MMSECSVGIFGHQVGKIGRQVGKFEFQVGKITPQVGIEKYWMLICHKWTIVDVATCAS